MSPGRTAHAALVLVALAACQEAAAPARTTEVEIATDRATAPVTDPIDFRYEARGRTLVGLVVDYGDGAADSLPMHGAQTARGSLTHAFDRAGMFEVTALLHDFASEPASDTVVVVITMP